MALYTYNIFVSNKGMMYKILSLPKWFAWDKSIHCFVEQIWKGNSGGQWWWGRRCSIFSGIRINTLVVDDAAVVAASAAADVATLQTLRFEYAIAVPPFLSTPWRYLGKQNRHVLLAEVKTGCSVSDISADHANTIRIFVMAVAVVRIGVLSSPNEIDH